MKFENISVYNFENALRGMRNPKESWDLSDSVFGIKKLDEDCGADVALAWAKSADRSQVADFVTEKDLAFDYGVWLWRNGILAENEDLNTGVVAFIGPKDMKLAQTLIKAGSEHRKFMRQIFVSVDITAPIYWWKEFDTYKVATVANSTSTMHKLATTPITIDNFETEELDLDLIVKTLGADLFVGDNDEPIELTAPWQLKDIWDWIIEECENLRQKYLETQDKRYWKALIQFLPEAWLQKRTVTMNYENLLGMCSKGQRRFHKLKEWSGEENSFIQFARQLPYAQELIFIDEIMQ